MMRRDPHTPEPGVTPEELARRAQQGSAGAFGALAEQFAPRLYHFLLRRVGSADDAEDLTQDTLIRAWQRIATFKPELRFSTWLFTIGVRLAAAHHRRKRPTGVLDGDPAGRGRETWRPAADADDHGHVWAIARHALSEDQFSALWLRYVEDARVEDIARILGKSRVGVRVLLFRGRERLARKLGPAREVAAAPRETDETVCVPRAIPEPAGGGVRC